MRQQLHSSCPAVSTVRLQHPHDTCPRARTVRCSSYPPHRTSSAALRPASGQLLPPTRAPGEVLEGMTDPGLQAAQDSQLQDGTGSPRRGDGTSRTRWRTHRPSPIAQAATCHMQPPQPPGSCTLGKGMGDVAYTLAHPSPTRQQQWQQPASHGSSAHRQPTSSPPAVTASCLCPMCLCDCVTCQSEV